eukprot:gene11346-13410_t
MYGQVEWAPAAVLIQSISAAATAATLSSEESHSSVGVIAALQRKGMGKWGLLTMEWAMGALWILAMSGTNRKQLLGKDESVAGWDPEVLEPLQARRHQRAAEVLMENPMFRGLTPIGIVDKEQGKFVAAVLISELDRGLEGVEHEVGGLWTMYKDNTESSNGFQEKMLVNLTKSSVEVLAQTGAHGCAMLACSIDGKRRLVDAGAVPALAGLVHRYLTRTRERSTKPIIPPGARSDKEKKEKFTKPPPPDIFNPVLAVVAELDAQKQGKRYDTMDPYVLLRLPLIALLNMSSATIAQEAVCEHTIHGLLELNIGEQHNIYIRMLCQRIMTNIAVHRGNRSRLYKAELWCKTMACTEWLKAEEEGAAATADHRVALDSSTPSSPPRQIPQRGSPLRASMSAVVASSREGAGGEPGDGGVAPMRRQPRDSFSLIPQKLWRGGPENLIRTASPGTQASLGDDDHLFLPDNHLPDVMTAGSPLDPPTTKSPSNAKSKQRWRKTGAAAVLVSVSSRSSRENVKEDHDTGAPLMWGAQGCKGYWDPARSRKGSMSSRPLRPTPSKAPASKENGSATDRKVAPVTGGAARERPDKVQDARSKKLKVEFLAWMKDVLQQNGGGQGGGGGKPDDAQKPEDSEAVPELFQLLRKRMDQLCAAASITKRCEQEAQGGLEGSSPEPPGPGWARLHTSNRILVECRWSELVTGMDDWDMPVAALEAVASSYTASPMLPTPATPSPALIEEDANEPHTDSSHLMPRRLTYTNPLVSDTPGAASTATGESPAPTGSRPRTPGADRAVAALTETHPQRPATAGQKATTATDTPERAGAGEWSPARTPPSASQSLRSVAEPLGGRQDGSVSGRHRYRAPDTHAAATSWSSEFTLYERTFNPTVKTNERLGLRPLERHSTRRGQQPERCRDRRDATLKAMNSSPAARMPPSAPSSSGGSLGGPLGAVASEPHLGGLSIGASTGTLRPESSFAGTEEGEWGNTALGKVHGLVEETYERSVAHEQPCACSVCFMADLGMEEAALTDVVVEASFARREGTFTWAWEGEVQADAGRSAAVAVRAQVGKKRTRNAFIFSDSLLKSALLSRRDKWNSASTGQMSMVRHTVGCTHCKGLYGHFVLPSGDQ